MAEKKKVEGKKKGKSSSGSKAAKRARHLGEHRAEKRHIKNVLLSSGLEAAMHYEANFTHVPFYAQRVSDELALGRRGEVTKRREGYRNPERPKVIRGEACQCLTCVKIVRS